MKVLHLFVIVALICALSVEVASVRPKGPVKPADSTSPARKLDFFKNHPPKIFAGMAKRDGEQEEESEEEEDEEEELDIDSNHGICPDNYGIGNGVVSWFLNPETFEAEFFYSGDDGLGVLDYECTLFQNTDMIHAFRVTIHEGFGIIGEYAFAGFENLVFVDLPSSLQVIGEYAFGESEKVASLNIPANVVEIGENAFYMTDIRSVTIPEGLSTIPASAFEECASLRTVNLVGDVGREIGDKAFANCGKLESINLDGVLTIGEAAFSGCSSLKDVAIPASVGAIGHHAFLGCSAVTGFTVDEENPVFYQKDSVLFQRDEDIGGILLAYPMANVNESFEIPEDVRIIAADAFYGCQYLKTLSLAYVEAIDDGTYGFLTGCKSLTSVTVPEDNDVYLGVNGVLFEKKEDDKLKLVRYPQALTQEDNTYTVDGTEVGEIGFAAFRGVNALNEVSLSDGITMIGGYAFSETSLVEVYIPATVTNIGDAAFSASAKMSKVEIPESVQKLGSKVFANCVGLKSVTLASGNLEAIPVAAFYGCSALESIVIPHGVTQIKVAAFSYCSSLTEVNISDTVNSIADGAGLDEPYSLLWPCPSLKSINVDGTNTVFVSNNGVLFEKKENEKLKLVRYPQALTQEDNTYTVDGSEVDEIGYGAFKAVSSLNAVVLSEGVTTINSYAFARTSLAGVEFPRNSLSLIKENAFFRSYSLTKVNIPNGTTIEKEAFFACKGLQSVTLPSDIDTIAEGAFEECESLESIYIPDSVLTIGKDAFKFCSSMESVRLPPNLESIGYSAFEECSSLLSVEIPDSTTFIGTRAFMYCMALNELTLPHNEGTEVGDYAFIFCPSLQSVYIPANIYFGYAVFQVNAGIQQVEFEDGRKDIPYGLFYGCSGLSELYIPDSVETIQDYAFGRCDGIVSLHISVNVTTIGSYAFYGLSHLDSLVIPETVELIGEGAFADCFSLEQLVIPKKVKKLKTLAFAGCRNLRHINMEEGLERIGLQCFMACSRLVSVSLPASVIYVGDYAFMDCMSLEHEKHNVTGAMKYYGVGVFKGCKNLVSVAVPPQIEAVPAELFANCSSLQNVSLPDTVQVIGESAFSGCSNMTTIDWPESVHEIGAGAFTNCTSLKELSIPETVTTIGDRAFEQCKGVTEVTIQNGLNTLGNYIFDGCSSLTTLTIPGSVSEIGEYAFAGMSSLNKIVVDGEGSNFYTLADGALCSKEGMLIKVPQGYEGVFVVPSNVSSISGSAFSGCRNLVNVTISASVVSIGQNSFDDLPNLQAITVEEGNYAFRDYQGVLFSSDYKSLVRYPGGKKGGFVIPDDTEVVEDFAFYGCDGLSEVTIPDSVNSIKSNAFKGCSKLQKIEIPGSVKTIGEYSFHGCSLLSDIVLQNGIERIESYAFSGCNPEGVTIPASVYEIGESIFDDCYNLVKIEVEDGSEYFSSANGALMDTFGRLVQFPKGFAGKFVIPVGVRSIDSKTFNGCVGLTEVTIPTSVETIDPKPFAGCKNLQSIIVDPENARYNGGISFYYDLYYLMDFATYTLIDYPEGRGGDFVVESDITLYVGERAFQGNKHLTSVVIPEGIMAIDDYAFEGCEALTKAKIGSTVTFIGDYVFAGCTNLRTIDYRGLKNPCDKVNNHTLEGTRNLRVVVMPDDYDENDDTFCGTFGFCLAESVEALNLRENQCTEENCHIGHRLNRTKDSAATWKAKSNACADFICHETLGPLQWSMCNKSSDGQSFMCINDGCLPIDQPKFVEITMEGIQAGDFDISLMKQEVQACAGTEISEAGYELGDNAYIVRVIIVIDDETVGQTIVDAVNNELEKGSGCQYRTLCRGKYARLVVNSLELSEARTNHVDMMLSIFAILAMVMAFFH